MSLSSADSAPDTNFAFNMEASTTTTARINKFDGMNFHAWKFKIQMVLEERDLWEQSPHLEQSRSSKSYYQTRCESGFWTKSSNSALTCVSGVVLCTNPK